MAAARRDVRVRVVGIAGDVCEVQVQRGAQVKALKAAIEVASSLPREEQRLFAALRELPDQERLTSLLDLLDEPADSQSPPATAKVVVVQLVRRSAEEVWRRRVARRPGDLEEAPAWCRSSRRVVHAALRADANALRHAAPELRASRRLALTAVRRDGRALRHAAPALRADREVVRAAVLSNAAALRHAAPELRANREVVLEAVEHAGMFEWNVLKYAAPALRRDEEVIKSDNAAFLRRWSRWNTCIVAFFLLLVVLLFVISILISALGRSTALVSSLMMFITTLFLTGMCISCTGWLVTSFVDSQHRG
eukprot:TRINITY_DN38326_c0_g1_i1.p1 TRINITY_DN38326_c0_g1~~TRINITY_DN38326_c0_g1_i1.p1  ORF type:complete len:309 (+),score=68.96 TRINITY_DN38326_c0_g1_i1:123-1049(+)